MAAYQVKDCTFTFDCDYKSSKPKAEVERLEGVIRNAKINLDENAERLARYERQLADAKAKAAKADAEAKAKSEAKRDIGTRYAEGFVTDGRDAFVPGSVFVGRYFVTVPHASPAERVGWLRGEIADAINAACKEAVEEDRKSRSKVRYYRHPVWAYKTDNAFFEDRDGKLTLLSKSTGASIHPGYSGEWDSWRRWIDDGTYVEIAEAEAKAVLKGGGK